jgi:methyl-accepting chemotaxis protein/ABC-type amino acid transport substrate-binding protein
MLKKILLSAAGILIFTGTLILFINGASDNTSERIKLLPVFGASLSTFLIFCILMIKALFCDIKNRSFVSFILAKKKIRTDLIPKTALPGTMENEDAEKLLSALKLEIKNAEGYFAETLKIKNLKMKPDEFTKNSASLLLETFIEKQDELLGKLTVINKNEQNIITDLIFSIEQLAHKTQRTDSILQNNRTYINAIKTVCEETQEILSGLENNASNAAAEYSHINKSYRETRDFTEKTFANTEKAIESIRTIMTYINMISEIASRTNVISVNAFIEAAQAGEFGKGFKNIAAGIKELSKTTGAEAEKSRQALTDITQEIGSAYKGLDKLQTSFTEIHTEVAKLLNIINFIRNNNAEAREIISSLLSSILQIENFTEKAADIFTQIIKILDKYGKYYKVLLSQNSKNSVILYNLRDYPQEFLSHYRHSHFYNSMEKTAAIDKTAVTTALEINQAELDEKSTGYYIDLLKSIYSVYGLEIKILHRNYDEAVKLLQAGTVDIFPGPYENEVKGVLYSKMPFDSDEICAVNLKKPAFTWQGVKTLEGKKTAYIKGYELKKYINADMIISEVPTVADGFRLLKTEKIDFFLHESDRIKSFIEENPDEIEENYCINPLSHMELYMCFADSSTGRELLKIWDSEFPPLLSEGAVNKLQRKWYR